MSAYETEKRKQHYVWRFYLESWAHDQQVYCLRDGKIFIVNIKDTAQKRDFYRVQELNEDDLGLLNSFIDNFPSGLQPIHRRLLELFALPHQGKRLTEMLVEAYDTKKHPEVLEIDSRMNIVINSMEEELHASIESNSIQFISSIRAEDIGFWDISGDKLNFLQFVCLQMLRTKKIQDSLKAVAAIKMPDDTRLLKLWGALRHMFALNISFSLHENPKYGLRLLLNDSNVPFLTTDQPVINIHGAGLSMFTIPDKFELYYPVSPRKAIMIGEFAQAEIYIGEDYASELNSKLVDMTHEQVYSGSEDMLKRVLSDNLNGKFGAA